MDKSLIIQHLFTNGTFDARKWRSASRIPGFNDLPGDSVSEKVWLVFNTRPKCFCGKQTAYINYTVGYRTSCSRRCAQTSPIAKFMKRHRQERYWSNPEWKESTALKMKEAHFRSRTPKKLERLFIEKKIIPLDEITPGQANVYRWQHVCGEVFVKPFSRIAFIYCPKCHVSQGQGELYEFIKSLYEGEIVVNDRAVIAPKEIDIYLPALKLGFEFNGKYWHQGDRSRELEKSSECKEAGIMLLHVWETEWNKQRAKVKAQVEFAIRSRMAN